MKKLFAVLVVSIVALTGCRKVEPTVNNTALIIIDAQEAYVFDSPELWISQYYPDLPISPDLIDPQQHTQIDNIATVARQATAGGFPTMLTFEISDEGSSRLIDRIAAELPADTPRYNKHFFDITKDSYINAALAQWQAQGITEVVVVGAETDVCVYQSVLGLTDMGFNVHLVQDAVFSTERNTAPTLDRWAEYGVNLIDSTLAGKIFASEKFVDESEAVTTVRLDRDRMGSLFLGTTNDVPAPVHHDFDAADTRMRAWTVMNEIVYGPTLGTPTMQIGDSFWAYASQYTAHQTIEEVLATMESAQKDQLVVSGIATVETLTKIYNVAAASGIEMFVIEDAWYGESETPLPLAQNVPWHRTTAKMAFYEINSAVMGSGTSADYNQAMEQAFISGELPPVPIELFPYMF